MTVTRGRAMGGVLWTVAQRWSVRLTTLGVFVVLGRLLTPADFGVVALASVFIGFVNVFSDFGLSTYLVQSRSVDQRSTSTVFWSGLALSTLLALLVCAAAGPVAALFGVDELAAVIRVMSVSIFVTAFSSTPTALLKRDLDFRSIALRSVVATVVSGAVAVGLAFAGAGVWSLVAQAVVFSSVSAVVLWVASRWRPSRAFDPATARQAMAYGSSVLGIQLVSQLRRRGADLAIGAVAGTVALGYWAVANRILVVVFDTVVQVISAVSTPVFARLKDDRPRLQRGYVTAVTLSLAVVVPVLVVLLVTAPVAIPLVFGGRWDRAVPVAQLLCVATLFTTMVYFDRGLMLAVGRQRLELVMATATAVGGLVLMVGAAHISLVFAAWAAVAQAALAWPVRVRVTTRVLDIPARPYVARQVRTVAAGAVAAAPAWLVVEAGEPRVGEGITLVLATACVAVLYPGALWLLNRPAVEVLLDQVRPAIRRRRGTPDRPASSGHPAGLGTANGSADADR